MQLFHNKSLIRVTSLDSKIEKWDFIFAEFKASLENFR